MYVDKIQSRKYKKTFYKVVFKDEKDIESFKESLEFYYQYYLANKEDILDTVEYQVYQVLLKGVKNIRLEDEELSFVLYDVQDILLMLFLSLEIWQTRDSYVAMYRTIIKGLNDIIVMAHNNPAILQGNSWEEIKTRIDSLL